MADHLASIYGTEKDKVNCSFYFKIGACRHGDRCSRKHVKPNYSPTVLVPNVYFNPAHDAACRLGPKQLQEHFDLFYEDFFLELAKYGEIEEMHVCDNVGDHLVGNVYLRYKYEQDAQKAVDGLNARFYGGRPLWAELSPVTDFRESCCRQYENKECNRGGFCNFMHLRPTTKKLKSDIFEAQRKTILIYKKKAADPGREQGKQGEEEDRKRKDRSRSRSRDRRRERSRDRRPHRSHERR